MIGLSKIIKLFEDGNVCVTGLRGKGKDMLMANVVVRRNLPYVSNLDYTDEYIPFNPNDFDCGKNDFRNFIDGNIKKYKFPYEDGTDIYISDAGIYFPTQYVSLLDRDYKYFPTYFALSRQVSSNNVHINVQNLNRCWTKLVEQSDCFIRCLYCLVLFGYVFQIVTLYDNYESCVKRVKPFSITLPLFASREMKQQYDIEFQRYEQTFGYVRRRILVYKNLSSYDTRKFKEMLERGN